MIQELVTRRYRRNLPSERGRECRYECRKDETDQSLRRQFSSIRFQVWIWRGDGGKIETKMSRPLACFALARPQNDRSLVLGQDLFGTSPKSYFLLFESSESKLFSQRHDAISKTCIHQQAAGRQQQQQAAARPSRTVRWCWSTGTLHVPSSSKHSMYCMWIYTLTRYKTYTYM